MKYIKTFEKNLFDKYNKYEQKTDELKKILSLITEYLDINGHKTKIYLDSRNWEIEFDSNEFKGKVILSIWNNKINIKIKTPNFKGKLIKYNNIFDFFINFLKNLEGLKYDNSINLMGGIDNDFQVINYQKVIDNLSKEIEMVKIGKKYNIL
jgi:hypothetical protein